MHLAALRLANSDEDPARGRIDRACQDWCVPASDEDGLPPLQPGRIIPADGERRDAVQRRLDRNDRAQKSLLAAVTIAQTFKRFQGNRMILAKRAGGGAPQRGNVAETAEHAAEIA